MCMRAVRDLGVGSNQCGSKTLRFEELQPPQPAALANHDRPVEKTQAGKRIVGNLPPGVREVVDQVGTGSVVISDVVIENPLLAEVTTGD